MARVYPSPSLVIGLGRFGLSVLERLGDDWRGLAVSGADPSLGNLRLVWVRSGAELGEAPWRRQERKTQALAQEVGEGDLPSLALDLVVLRTLGLVRYRDGVYQVAVPRDAGVAKAEEEGGGGPAKSQVRRRRFFDWWSLSPDPIAAVERLRRLAERHNDLELFITPILNRVRQGHSPRLLLAVIGRCQALAEGRDPSPWGWVKEELRKTADLPRGEEGEVRIPLVAGLDAGTDLDGFAPEPLPAGKDGEAAAMVLPGPFIPRPTDVPTPADPKHVLKVDWEATGWASEADNHVHFELVDASQFRLGLFDHDADCRRRRLDELLVPRLHLLAEHVYRGLLRLWVDLQRERVEELDPNLEHRLRQEQLDTALRQCLEVLGVLLVRPLVSETPPETPFETSGKSARGEAAWAAGEPDLAGRASRFLSGLSFDPEEDGDDAERSLEERLGALGEMPSGAGSKERIPLLCEVELQPREGVDDDEGSRPEGLLALRRALNEAVRSLYSFSFLAGYRDSPTRRPPRLSVYVVGDMGEPFTRASAREVLREIHAELLRSFSPIFEIYREGFNRCLSVVPIFSMPHPADPFSGAHPAESRGEEAVIIDAVHGVRRWVESVLPASRRRVSQIFINGRVTDNSVLSLHDAVQQTRDFLSFQMRNDISRDDWLRRTATGPGGDDLFSSFACHEIEFPAERSREYLANRLARACLSGMKRGRIVSALPSAPEGIGPPPIQGLVEEATAELIHLTGEAAGRMGGDVGGRVAVARETAARTLLTAYDEGFEADLLRRIQGAWSELTQRRGRVDDEVAALRRKTSALIPAAVTRVQEHSDRLVEDQAGQGGLPAARAGFERLVDATRTELQRREEERRRWEEVCRRHRIPDLGSVRAARAAVAAAAARKPDLPPMQLGLALVALLSFVLGAPFAEAVAGLLGGKSLAAVLFGRFDGLLGGALVSLVAGFLLLRFMDHRVRAVRLAIEGLAQQVREVIHGRGEPPEREARPSVRSFLETRLHLSGVLAVRGYALRVFERSFADSRLLYRLSRSLDIQLQCLVRAAEDLGVRPAGNQVDGSVPRDDLRNLFASRSGERGEPLIDPERLQEYFERRIGRDDELGSWIPGLLRAGGGLGDWRRSACLADRRRILAFCRAAFDDVVSTPVAEQDVFAAEVGERLCRFVARRYPNLGFGAKFVGYEGLDPDGVFVKACASLVLAPGLSQVYERARQREGAPATTDTMEVIEAQVRPNAAYMMSLVQGIRAHSVRNLRRFESFHDRVHMPDDRTFPLAQEEERTGESATINYLSGYTELGEQLRASLGRSAALTVGREALDE